MAALRALEERTYLTFEVGGETFAVDVRHVREVLDYAGVTRLPCGPDFMRGIINLRGKVIPVVDLRLKFGMPVAAEPDRPCIIVMETGGGEKKTLVGALADAVREVCEFDPGRIESPPLLGGEGKAAFIQGIGKRENGFVIILSVDRIFAAGEIDLPGTLMEIAAGVSGNENSATAEPGGHAR